MQRSQRWMALAFLVAALCLPGMVRPQAALARCDDDNPREQALEAFESFNEDVGAVLETAQLSDSARKALHTDLRAIRHALTGRSVDDAGLANGIAQFSADALTLFQAGDLNASQAFALYGDLLTFIDSLEQIGILPGGAADTIVDGVLSAVQKVREA